MLNFILVLIYVLYGDQISEMKSGDISSSELKKEWMNEWMNEWMKQVRGESSRSFAFCVCSRVCVCVDRETEWQKEGKLISVI